MRSEARLFYRLSRIATSFVGIMVLSGVVFLGVAKLANAANLTTKLNFTNRTSKQNVSFFYTPYTMGAVGKYQIVEINNSEYTVFDKNNDTLVLIITPNQFWTNVAVTSYIAANMFFVGADSTSTGTTILALPKLDPTTGSIADYTINDNLDLDNTSCRYLAYNSNYFKRLIHSHFINWPTLNMPDEFIAVTSYNNSPSAWGVQSLADNSQSALRWFELDSAINTEKQEGLISDAYFDYFHDCIASNGSDDPVIGFSGSSGNQFASSHAVLGLTVGKMTTFNTSQSLKKGVDSYQIPGSTNSNYFQRFQKRASRQEILTQVTQVSSKPVPEPLTIVGSSICLGFGAFLKKRYAKKLKK